MAASEVLARVAADRGSRGGGNQRINHGKKEKSTPKIHGKERNSNQLPLSVSVSGCSFRGYPFVMIFLAGG